MPLVHRLPPARPLPFLLLALALAGRLPAQVTETPQTIEPGKVLVRMDAISLGIKPDSSEPNAYRALAVGSTVVSAGLTDSLDLEVGAQLFLRDTLQLQHSNRTQDGIGDVTFRSKWTFWRDPAQSQAAAVIPYVKIPTNSNGVGNNFTEGGIIVPWARKFGLGSSAGAMLEWDVARNAANTRYDSRWYTSGFLQWDLFGKLGAYAESTLSVSTAGTSSFSGTVNGGATLSISKNFQWDYEIGRVLGASASAWVQTLRFRWKL